MLAKDIELGKHYEGKVNDRLVTVRVDKIDTNFQGRTRWYVTNLDTGRQTIFRSAVKFKRPAEPTCPEPGCTFSTGLTTVMAGHLRIAHGRIV